MCVCVCRGACCSKCGWLYESPSEVGGALLVKYLCTCARSVTTVNSSRVTSAQVKNPVCVFIFKNRKKREQHSWPSQLCSPAQQQQQQQQQPPASLHPSVILFLCFSASHPAGCRNVETRSFKNSILSSVSAAPLAPQHCGARSRNAKMATDLGELLVPYMPTIRVPRTGDRVFKSECAFSFDSPVSVRLCLSLSLSLTHTQRDMSV